MKTHSGAAVSFGKSRTIAGYLRPHVISENSWKVSSAASLAGAV
ncbi:hypothetical protein ACFQQB_57590 [Nonomuraea rubra]